MRKKNILRSPWKIDGSFDDGVDVAIIDADGNEILGVSPQDGPNLDEWGERSLAIAHLAVAAPELLRLLRSAAETLRHQVCCNLEAEWKESFRNIAEASEQLIAKAEGRA